ncbi:MAG: tetratricopeptide repeat protein [Flavobacteriales bacterium]|nr:tetratricopeptide repeat protein [Flavobacteriales bacterium]
MMKSSILLLLSAMAISSHGQNVDSLAVLELTRGSKGTLADTIRIDAILDSAKAWVSTGGTESPVMATDAVLDLIARIPGDPPQLLVRTLQANKLQGVAHHYAGRYAPALSCFQEMEKAAKALGRKKDEAAALNYQGYQYRSMDETERALEITQRSLAILQTLPPDGNLANTYSGLGTIHFELEQFDKAMAMHHRAVELHISSGNDGLAALSRMDLAELHNRFGRFDSAYHELSLARPLIMGSENPPDQCIFLYHEAHALLGLGRTDEAERNAQEAMRLAKEVGNDEHLHRTNELLALLASAKGRYKEALQKQDSSRAALINSLDLEKAQELTEVRLTADHEREQALLHARVEEERQMKRSTMIGGGLILLVAVLLAALLFTTRRKNAQILAAQQRVVDVEKQRENEQVRTRIARDIHDDIGSGLTKIAMLGSEAKRSLQEHSNELRTALDRIIVHSREVNAALSDIVWTVDPLHDTSGELVRHAREVAHRLLSDSGVACTLRFNHHDPEHPVAPGTKHHVVMVMKEAINNAMKYANAQHITVQLDAGARHVKLVVTDNGSGFDPEALARNGNGLRNMRARAEAMGATLLLNASPGQGCTVTLEGTLA